MKTIRIKPMSVNMCWVGRRWMTPKYKAWRLEMSLKLPKLDIPKGLLKLSIEFGFSSKGSDIDNSLKSVIDSLQLKYGFNDNQIYELNIIKRLTSKGEEYIRFKIEAIDLITKQ